jgi:hypothetical protein
MAAGGFVFDENRYDRVYKYMRMCLYSDLRIRIFKVRGLGNGVFYGPETTAIGGKLRGDKGVKLFEKIRIFAGR